MSPGIPLGGFGVLGVARGGVRRWARPPQSMHVMTGSGSSTATVCQVGAYPRADAHRGRRARGRRLVAPAGRRPGRRRTRCARRCSTPSPASTSSSARRSPTSTPAAGRSGIEALSRGAAHCTFVERDRAAVACDRREPRHARPPAIGHGSSSATASPSAAHSTPTSSSPTRRTGSTTGPGCCARARADARRRRGGPRGAGAGGLGAGRVKRYGRTWVTFLHRDDRRRVTSRAWHYGFGTHGHRAQPRQLRPDPPRAPRRRRAGRRAVRPRHRRRDAQPREAGGLFKVEERMALIRASRRRRRHRRSRRRRRPRRPRHRRRRGGRSVASSSRACAPPPTSRSSSRWRSPTTP